MALFLFSGIVICCQPNPNPKSVDFNPKRVDFNAKNPNYKNPNPNYERDLYFLLYFYITYLGRPPRPLCPKQESQSRKKVPRLHYKNHKIPIQSCNYPIMQFHSLALLFCAVAASCRNGKKCCTQKTKPDEFVTQVFTCLPPGQCKEGTIDMGVCVV
jgi:hypothetical protein